MLVLTRSVGQEVKLDVDCSEQLRRIVIQVLSVKDDTVQLGIEAESTVKVV